MIYVVEDYGNVKMFKNDWLEYFEKTNMDAEECIEELEASITDESCYDCYDDMDQNDYVLAAQELIEEFKKELK
jgi:hypothetical protein